MTRWLMLGVLVVALVAANLWQYQQIQQQTQRAVVAERAAANRLALLTQLQTDATQRKANGAELRATQHQLEQKRQAQQLKFRELQRANQPYQDWANRPLPDLTQRLHKHPTFNGASDYQQWLLSRDNALQPARSSAADQR